VQPLDGSKGEAHFVMKWPGGNGQQAYMKIVDMKGVDGTYQADATGSWVTILALECRGLKPIQWIPEMDFIAESSAGHYFEQVELTEHEHDWAEYDEENDLAVSITNFECKIE
jgi:hypothetical protein